MDDDGYLSITGRLKEIINRGGEKICPREVDEILMDHPAVAQVVTFAMPHDKLGEEVAAAVVLREGKPGDREGAARVRRDPRWPTSRCRRRSCSWPRSRRARPASCSASAWPKARLAGEDVTFIARNKNLAAISANGFRLIDEAGVEHHAAAAKAVGDAAAIGAQDVVLLTVKAHQVKDVLAQLAHLVGRETMLVTMVNGMPWWYFQGLEGEWRDKTLESVDPGGLIARAIDPARVIGSIVYPAAELVAPGVVRAIEGNRFTIGEPSGERTARIEALSKALMSAGFKAPIARDIRAEIWVKLWGNLSFNPVSALTGATLEGICRDPDGRAL